MMMIAFAVLGPAVGRPSPGAVGGSISGDEREVQELVDAARRGEREAARRLYQLHAARVFRAVRPMCRDRAETEDVVQDTFIKAFAALARYERREGARFVSWLLRIATNTALKSVRARRAQPMAPEKLDALREVSQIRSADPAGEAIDLRLRRAALLTALGELSERERNVISLRYGGELSAAEVADIVGVSEANVRKICERQRSRLKSKIEALLADPRRPVEASP